MSFRRIEYFTNDTNTDETKTLTTKIINDSLTKNDKIQNQILELFKKIQEMNNKNLQFNLLSIDDTTINSTAKFNGFKDLDFTGYGNFVNLSNFLPGDREDNIYGTGIMKGRINIFYVNTNQLFKDAVFNFDYKTNDTIDSSIFDIDLLINKIEENKTNSLVKINDITADKTINMNFVDSSNTNILVFNNLKGSDLQISICRPTLIIIYNTNIKCTITAKFISNIIKDLDKCNQNLSEQQKKEYPKQECPKSECPKPECPKPECPNNSDYSKYYIISIIFLVFVIFILLFLLFKNKDKDNIEIE